MISNWKVELIDPVIIKGYPQKEDYISLKKLAEEIARKHNSL